QLAEDRGHVVVDSFRREEQAVGDVTIAESLRHQAQDFGLTLGEFVGMRSGRVARASRDVMRAKRAQASSHERGRRSGAQALELLQRPTEYDHVSAVGKRLRLLVGATSRSPI